VLEERSYVLRSVQADGGLLLVGFNRQGAAADFLEL